MPSTPFPKISLLDAKKELEKIGITSEKWFDLSAEEEKAISSIMKEKTGSDFVFITDHPIEARPFYHRRHSEGKLTCSADLLYKGLEITTLSAREHRIEVLESQAIDKGMELSSLLFMVASYTI